MPVLPLSPLILGDVRHARRAHLVLSFLAHFYLHSQPAPAVGARPAPRSWRSFLSAAPTPADAADAADADAEARGVYAETVPAPLAVPWVAVSQHLDLPPILTYATTVLWNWYLVDEARGLVSDNMRIATTFTGTRSEEHFYAVSLAIELRGVEALKLMRVSLDEAFVADALARRRIAAYLGRIAAVVDELRALLHSMSAHCEPATFYWGIRPWFRGADGGGWHYEGVDAPGTHRRLTGPSAGQSSLIHALDVFLDVDHSQTKPRVNRPVPRLRRRGAPAAPADAHDEADAGAAQNATFMERMQLYMPGHHRAFLTHLRNLSFDDSPDGPPAPEPAESDAASTSGTSDDGEEALPPAPSHPIRTLALATPPAGKQDGLRAAYDAALASLRQLRDEHMRIATLYIISQARRPPPAQYAVLPASFSGAPAAPPPLETLATAPSAAAGAPKGTGGTDLVSFLKECRSNTLDAMLGPGDAPAPL